MTEQMSHEKAVELLPWFVNGTLSGRERELVERHVRACLACHAELREQRALRALVQEHPTVHHSAEHGFGQLLRRMQGHRSRRRPRTLHRWIGRYTDKAVQVGRLAVGALVLVTVLGAASWLIVAGSDSEQQAGYVTLTSGSVRGEPLLDIVFSNHVTEEEMRALLREIDGTVVGGPSDVGRYTVRLSAARVTEAELAELLQRLFDDDRVRFAARTVAPEGRE